MLAITNEPDTSVTAGSAFDVALVALDQYGNAATQFSGSVAVALKTNAGNNLLGKLSANATAGALDFPSLILDAAATGYTIQATSPGLTSVTTGSFSVVPAAAAQLIITAFPGTVNVNKPISLAVLAEDLYGNVATTATGTITLSLKKKPKGGKLLGRSSATLSGGMATFSALKFKKKGAGFEIQAAGAGLAPAVTAPFNVTVAKKKRK
jgi:hypothetical protein